MRKKGGPTRCPSSFIRMRGRVAERALRVRAVAGGRGPWHRAVWRGRLVGSPCEWPHARFGDARGWVGNLCRRIMPGAKYRPSRARKTPVGKCENKRTTRGAAKSVCKSCRPAPMFGTGRQCEVRMSFSPCYSFARWSTIEPATLFARMTINELISLKSWSESQSATSAKSSLVG